MKGHPRLSPWIDGSVKPVRLGVYQRRFQGGDTGYARWDGRQWHVSSDDRDDAATVSQRSQFQRGLVWRGLAQP